MSVEILQNVDLKSFNSWHVGGNAEFLASPKDLSELLETIQFANDKSLEITVLGEGSNVLISDKGISGLVLSLKNFSGIESQEVIGDTFKIIALAGTSKIELMRCFLKQKLTPALFLSGLPGNLAGGIVMNAGVSEDRKPREFCEIVDWVEVLDTTNGQISKFQKQDIEWVYRSSHGWQPGVIIRAGLAWPFEPDKTIPKQVIEANKSRTAKQPLDLPSCGSTFKNPEGTSAGKVIEDCGLKGFQVGGAQVSPKHANFIVNIDNAKASDIHDIIRHIQTVVKQKTQIELTTEVKYLGDW